MKKLLIILLMVSINTIGFTQTKVKRTPLIEQFNSSSEGTSILANSNLKTLLDSNPNKWTLIKYPLNWPNSGSAYFIQDCIDRVNYYYNGIYQLPNMRVNGIVFYNPSSINQNDFNSFYDNDSTTMNIEAGFYINGNSINLDIKTTSTINIHADSAIKLQIAVVEKVSNGNIGSNGETEWYYTVLKTYNNFGGINISPLQANNTIVSNITIDMSGTFVEEMGDLEVVIFTQNDSNKFISQSTFATKNLGISKQNKSNIGIYPNPSSDIINIKYGNLNNNNVILNITNIFGQNIYSSNNIVKSVDISQFPIGIYNIDIITENGKNTQKFMVIR